MTRYATGVLFLSVFFSLFPSLFSSFFFSGGGSSHDTMLIAAHEGGEARQDSCADEVWGV
jgi:hypothetical protein